MTDGKIGLPLDLPFVVTYLPLHESLGRAVSPAGWTMSSERELLLEGMGSQDAPTPPVGPKETETPFSSPLAPKLPSLYFILFFVFVFAEEFEKMP